MDQTDWTREYVISELPFIRRLKGVAMASVDEKYLYILTKNLRHPKSFRKLAPIEILLPLIETRSAQYRYLKASSARWNPHPTLTASRTESLQLSGDYKNVCTGDNAYDYLYARREGPRRTVMNQLEMLQTIQRDEHGSRPPKRELVPGIVFAGIIFVYVVVFYITMLHII